MGTTCNIFRQNVIRRNVIRRNIIRRNVIRRNIIRRNVIRRNILRQNVIRPIIIRRIATFPSWMKSIGRIFKVFFLEVFTGVMTVFASYRLEGETFFRISFYHFVEDQKLHNISKIQPGVFSFQKMAPWILSRIDRKRSPFSSLLNYKTPLNRRHATFQIAHFIQLIMLYLLIYWIEELSN